MAQSKRRSRRHKPGSMDALRRELWAAVMAAGDLLDDDDPATRLRAVHAVSQSAAAYQRVYESSDLEARLEALEQALSTGR